SPWPAWRAARPPWARRTRRTWRARSGCRPERRRGARGGDAGGERVSFRKRARAGRTSCPRCRKARGGRAPRNAGGTRPGRRTGADLDELHRRPIRGKNAEHAGSGEIEESKEVPPAEGDTVPEAPGKNRQRDGEQPGEDVAPPG